MFLFLLGRHLWLSFPTEQLGDLTLSVGSYWILPVLVAGLVLYGWSHGVMVYESLVEGAKQGFQVAVRIIRIWWPFWSPSGCFVPLVESICSGPISGQ